MIGIFKIRQRRIAAAATVLALSGASAMGFGFVNGNLLWTSADCGGGVHLVDGDYSISATIGQANAVVLIDGDYMLIGGFVQTDDAFPKNAVQGSWRLY